MTNDIYQVLRYFKQFSYPPTKDEIYTFLKKRVSKREFEQFLLLLLRKNRVKRNKTGKYTLGEYGIFYKINKRFSLYSQSKLKNIEFYISILKIFPQIQFIGLSGSISMMHADKRDDVDLFIIASKKRLWTARFITNIIAYLLGLKRKRLVQQAKDKVCLNLFFEHPYLTVPRYKKNEYVAHEILQVKPLVNKNHEYERFLRANKWVFRLFPNAKTIFLNYIKPSLKRIKYSRNSLGDLIEQILKAIQLARIMKYKTSEIVTSHQLWFFPDDFERKINLKS